MPSLGNIFLVGLKTIIFYTVVVRALFFKRIFTKSLVITVYTSDFIQVYSFYNIYKYIPIKLENTKIAQTNKKE